MNFMLSSYTDVGLRKKTNQDSLLLEKASSSFGEIAFGVVCDGMGGFAKGELASSTLVKAFKEWFDNRFKELVYAGFSEANLRRDWNDIVQNQNIIIQRYGEINGIRLGTTLTGILIYRNRYYIISVGDSRIYHITPDSIKQLTKDHTFVQKEIDAGRMTKEEAIQSNQRSVLLQCVGASEEVYPDFFSGPVSGNEVFLLCCDGFVHVVSEAEFLQYLNPNILENEEDMFEYSKYLVDLNKYRNEMDNITVGLIKAC
ncbi:MAG: serine/threonine-protein phosphatase [Eubacterium sp.]|nr:serine/threonine-protein phosphatase [Eubacterium sp.]